MRDFDARQAIGIVMGANIGTVASFIIGFKLEIMPTGVSSELFGFSTKNRPSITSDGLSLVWVVSSSAPTRAGAMSP